MKDAKNKALDKKRSGHGKTDKFMREHGLRSKKATMGKQSISFMGK